MLFEFSNQILAAKLNLEKPKKEFVSSKIVTDSRKISKGDCFLALKGLISMDMILLMKH